MIYFTWFTRIFHVNLVDWFVIWCAILSLPDFWLLYFLVLWCFFSFFHDHLLISQGIMTLIVHADITFLSFHILENIHLVIKTYHCRFHDFFCFSQPLEFLKPSILISEKLIKYPIESLEFSYPQLQHISKYNYLTTYPWLSHIWLFTSSIALTKFINYQTIFTEPL